jgi:hypothetical protein
MTDSPRRKKPSRPGRTGGRKRPKKKQPAAAKASPAKGEKASTTQDLDLRTLVRLSMGDWSELADLEWPPDSVCRWLAKADVRQVRGMLLTTLHRWHELRRDKGPHA